MNENNETLESLINNEGSSSVENKDENTNSTNFEQQNAELEKKLGEMGKELGDFRQFFESVSPLLDKLDSNPALVKAIWDGKIDDTLIEKVTSGEITQKQAEDLTSANEAVKKEKGNSYDKLSGEEIEKLIEKKLESVKGEVDSSINEIEEKRAYEMAVKNFTEQHPDIADLAEDIGEWLDKHPNVTDLPVAYYAVKGELTEKQARKQAEKEQKDYAKNLILSSGAGNAGLSSGTIKSSEIVDGLIADSANTDLF